MPRIKKSYLKWENLFKNKCPQCGRDWDSITPTQLKCYRCGFYCSVSAAERTMSDMRAREEQEELDNQSDKYLEEYGQE